MKLEIKSGTGRLIYSAEAASVRELVLLAIKDGASLRGADLSGAAALRGEQ